MLRPVLVVLVIAAIGALPWLDGPAWSSGSKVTERLDSLEAEQRRLGRVVAEMGSDVALVDTRSERSAVQVARVLPASALWIELRGGGNAQWDLGEHGRARVEFLEDEEQAGGSPKFRVNHRAGQITVQLMPGQTMRAVDEQGSRQVSYLLTMHSLRLDRSGRPDLALLSVTIED
jgi:hypothetical protein